MRLNDKGVVISLCDLSLEEYDSLCISGLLWVFYPEATGYSQIDTPPAVPVKTWYTGDGFGGIKKVIYYDIKENNVEYIHAD